MEFQYITNPQTGRKVNVNTKLGQNIIKNYMSIQKAGCGGCSVSSAANPILSGGAKYTGSSNAVNYVLLGGDDGCGFSSKTGRCGKANKESPELCMLNPATNRCALKKAVVAKAAPAKPVAKAASPKPVAKVASPKPVVKAASTKPVAKVASKKRGPRPVKEVLELSASAKGTVRENCVRQTTKRYTSRPSPPYPATACCLAGEFVKEGKQWTTKDGRSSNLYYAKQDSKKSSCQWKQCRREYHPDCLV